MYTKEEKKKYTADFWNSFGLYMKKYNKDYGRIKWVNYRSNVKDLFFRLNITSEKATFSIELQHKDDGIRALFFEQFKELKIVLEGNIKGDLIWEENGFNYFNEPISLISSELDNVSIYNRNDWQQIFYFFEQRMVGLHTFWVEFEEIFKELEK
ncbi:MAG: DUF4268 domain-containing protein [Flavobacteriales bacterium]|nr:DUF4268 domain-containing protein [Flavobacteriales bacterium]